MQSRFQKKHQLAIFSRLVMCSVASLAWTSPEVRSGDEFPDEPRSGLHRLFHRGATPEAIATGPEIATAAEIAQRIDRVAESIRNDGIVVLKQPDVFSQARMTKYRREFEEIMAKEAGNFKVILAGRVARVDSASLDSQTSLSAALTPPGSSVKVTPPTTMTPPVAPALDGSTDGPRFLSNPSLGQDNLNLGLEPNTVLDEHKSYLDRLHQIRRVNLGNDVADSAGYGLYLIRMPVSITPGECTLMGHGAETSVTIKHEFPPNFLASTFRNLVINDLVDQLAPPIYEVVRVRVDHRREIQALKEQLDALRSDAETLRMAVIKDILEQGKSRLIRIDNEDAIGVPKPGPSPIKEEAAPPPPEAVPPKPDPQDAIYYDFVGRVSGYVLRVKTRPEGASSPSKAEADRAIGRRLEFLIEANRKVLDRWQARLDATPAQKRSYQKSRALLETAAADYDKARRGLPRADNIVGFSAGDLAFVQILLERVLLDFFQVRENLDVAGFSQFISGLYADAYPDDVTLIDDAFRLMAETRGATAKLATANLSLAAAETKFRGSFREIKTIRLPSDRVAKRSYPIAPRELVDFFLESNLDQIAKDIEQGRPTATARASDIRSYLRQQLSVAYDLMSRPAIKGVEAHTAPLDDQASMDQILDAIHRRAFEVNPASRTSLPEIYHDWIAKLPNNLETRPLGALCWAIAVDAALLDESLREQAAVTFQANSLPCPDWASIRFYFVQPEMAAQAATVFNDYVASRWPVITFALDPVVDQQNILDSFSLRRDLQLALAFAFSTGKISFNQLTTFRRKIQQDEETIALNKTITSFAHGNETFGWRITPRFQTPPTQGNLSTLATTLLNGGPGNNYGLKKSKIEPGQRELVAVVIMPSFLPTIRVESSGNWFRLDDPEHLEVRTRRMLEQGRRVHELRQQVASACDAARYRPADVRHLRTKIDQIDAMLPIQSKVVALPFDNASAGFDLFTEGTTALVPELSGFEGVDYVVKGQEADLLVYGKFISIHETRVVAGGRELKQAGDVGFEILSREVIRVHLPADVQSSKTQDGQEFVEIYLATPNGISNRLLVPYNHFQASSDSSGGPKDDPNGTVVTTYSATQKVFPPKGGQAATAPAATTDPTKPATNDQKLPDPGKLVPGTTKTDTFTPAVSESEPPPKSTSRDQAAKATLTAFREPSGITAGLAKGAEAARLPVQAGSIVLPPLPAAVDPAVLRSSVALARAAATPAAVVMPTPIVVMPPATPPAKPKHQSRVGKLLDRLHGDKGSVPQVPRP